MIEVGCPICGSGIGYRIIYKENLPLSEINFSARKTPDRHHYRIVKCSGCGLLYSNPFLKKNQILQLYQKSQFAYNTELENLKNTYGHYLREVENLVPSKGNLLEIGCGNGFFLEKALELGYQNVYGVEPSREAVKKASPIVKDKIIEDIFDKKYFQENFFDVICFFQVLEHVFDLNSFFEGCHRCLKLKGIVLCIAHNFDSFISKIFKDKCPIINDEHIYIFNKETLRKIFFKNNFQVVKIGAVTNHYSLTYWLKMMVMPFYLRTFVQNILRMLKVEHKKIKIKAGNIFIVSRKS